ncbi:hypothetical protein XELAEV_18040527mg [Xenopus laevis]|uniref:Ig-like domain-containing protein n=1 Tax=Xenopus laevis TaxID=8355 RepID=A0A974C9W5_XENLA|nr:hypothetical protein XELAEV_18040527mg [Xenopus laevis]
MELGSFLISVYSLVDLFSKPDITVSPDWIPEGSAMSIFCHSLPKSETFPLQYALYKNGEMVRGFSHSNEWKFSSARSEDSGDYTCGAKTPTLEKKMSHVLKIQIAELFSRPEVKVSPSPLAEGSNMTITCDTALHPSRRSTQLQFAFYVNGSTVQKFSLSKKYQVYSVVPKDLGDYSCAAATPTVSILKISKVMKIQIQGRNYTVQNTVRLTMSAFIFLLASCLVFHHLKTHQQMESKSRK